MTGNGSTEIDSFIRNLQLLAFLTRHYIEGQFVEEATQKPLSFTHMNLIRVLDQSPGKTVGEIASYMNVSYPAATKTIDKLVRLGYIKRREDQKDRRIAHLHLTSSGKKIVEKYDNLKRAQIELIVGNNQDMNIAGFNEQITNFAKSIVNTIPLRSGICIQCGAFDPDHCKALDGEKRCGYLDNLDNVGNA